MILGICGTHGTGKSTILNAAKDAGCKVDFSQLSRTAQKQLGWDSLSKAQESVDNMWALQDAILCAMYDRDQKIIKSGELTIVERTPADAWAYTALWCSRLGIDVLDRFIQDKKADVYRRMCRDLAREYARFVVVPPITEIPFEADPNRADESSRTFVEKRINEFLWDGLFPQYTITTNSRNGRAAEIQGIFYITKAHAESSKILPGDKNAN